MTHFGRSSLLKCVSEKSEGSAAEHGDYVFQISRLDFVIPVFNALMYLFYKPKSDKSIFNCHSLKLLFTVQQIKHHPIV